MSDNQDHEATPTPETRAANAAGFWDTVAEYRKGLAGFLVPGLVTLGAALLEGSEGGSAVTAGEWVGIAVATLATGAVVTALPNRQP